MTDTRATKTRVVITGVGAITPLGVGAQSLHEGWLAGRSGIEDGVGACGDFDATEFMTAKQARRSDRFAQLAIGAGALALQDAGWELDEPPCDPDSVGCVIGSGIGGMGTFEDSCGVLRDRGPERVSPLAIPLIMGNAASGVVAMRHGIRGPVFGVMSACASGTHAIGAAARMIEAGEARAVITGGAEATLTPLAKAAFAAMDATSPSGISRPFDARRDGFVMGEGAGLLVLEDAELAAERGAPILGEVLGYAATSDAHHLTAPDPSGRSAALAITRALADAGIAPDELDYVNAHGTSTPLNDRSETQALKQALGEQAASIPVSSTKSAIGHLLGAAGAVEAIATVLALRDRRRPADARLRAAGGGCGPRLRAGRPAPDSDPVAEAAGRDLELVRVRRAQRRSLPRRCFMSLALVQRPETTVSPLERMELLCDPGSLDVIRSEIISLPMGEKARQGDGVVGGAGMIDGRPVFCYAQDASFAGGSLGEQHANTIVRVMELADRAKAPVVGFIASGGARMQEGVAALGGYGRIFRRIVQLSGRVPQVSIVTGVSAGGGAYSPALTDFVVMTEQSTMFLTGPAVVRDALGEEVTASELGGKRVHERNGVCHFVTPSDIDGALLARDLLGYLPSHRGQPAPVADAAARAGRRSGRAGAARGPPRVRRARRDPRARRRRQPARGLGRLGAQHRHRVRPDRGPARSA